MKVKTNTFANLSPEQLELNLSSNALLLFMAGFDTSASLMAVLMVMLAKHQEIQDKVYQEVKDAVEENNGDHSLDYNTIQAGEIIMAVPTLLKAHLHKLKITLGPSLLGQRCARNESFLPVDSVGTGLCQGLQTSRHQLHCQERYPTSILSKGPLPTT